MLLPLLCLSLSSTLIPVIAEVPSCPHCQDDCNGDRSVAYVIDNTGSMRNDIGQVCQRTREMINAVEDHDLQNSIHRCLLVPFGDPVVGPPQFFNHLNELADAACNLQPSGGVDCPEKVLSGLLMGIESSCPHSTVYVFTDAIAKDVNILARVLEVVQRKQIKVIFVLSGTCYDADPPYYDTIATISGGQLFRIGKEGVGDILKFSQLSINNKPQVSLLWERSKAPFWSSDFIVEPAMTSAQVVVSCDGDTPSVQLLKPEKLEAITPTQPSLGVQWRDFQNTVMAVIDTEAIMSTGVWQLYVASMSSCRVSVTAHDVPDMSSSFAKITEINMFGEIISETDGSQYIVVESPESHIIQYVELVGVDGNRFSTSSPAEGGVWYRSNKSETTLGPAEMPEESFFIRLRGLQNTSEPGGPTEGKPFKRYSNTALIPTAKPLDENSNAIIKAAHCQELKLHCAKSKHGPKADDFLYPITWFRNGDALLADSLPNMTLIETPSKSVLMITRFRMEHAGVYSCFVASKKGLQLAAEYEITADELTTRSCPEDRVVPGSPSVAPAHTPSVWRPKFDFLPCLVLPCLARGDNHEPDKVRWTNTQSGKHFNRSAVHRHYTVLRDGSLRICDPQRQHIGWYMCKTPYFPRPSAIRVKSIDIQQKPTSGSDDDEDEQEEVMNILKQERDLARQDAANAKALVERMTKKITDMERRLYNAEAERLRAVGG